MTPVVWISFIAFVLVVITFDLVVLHRKTHVIGIREALGWTAFYVALGLGFTAVIYWLYEHHYVAAAGQLHGSEAAIQYLTGYLVEESLSVDNIFVIAMVFQFFQIPSSHQHRVLFWGIMGAIILRGAMIGLGAALIHAFEWTVYVFGALLLFSAYKMLRMGDEEIHPDQNIAVRIARRMFPVHTDATERRFFVRIDGRLAITTQFLALLLVETSDVMFAVDSIPAIFAVTRDPFLVFTSNIFAILGLRSLYFAVAGLMNTFKYLKVSLVVLLGYIGVKMLLSHTYPINNLVSLGVIVAILAVGIVASLVARRNDPPPPDSSSTQTPVSNTIEARP